MIPNTSKEREAEIREWASGKFKDGSLHIPEGVPSFTRDLIGMLDAARDAARSVNPDDPDLDATEGAHPAWWRGHDYVAEKFLEHVQHWLSGKDDGEGAIGGGWQEVREKIIELIETTNPDRLCDYVLRWLDGECDDDGAVGRVFGTGWDDVRDRIAVLLSEPDYSRDLERRTVERDGYMKRAEGLTRAVWQDEPDAPPMPTYYDTTAKIRSLRHELHEVRRAFEKFGIPEMLVAADNSISYSLAVLRLCRFIAGQHLIPALKTTKT